MVKKTKNQIMLEEENKEHFKAGIVIGVTVVTVVIFLMIAVIVVNEILEKNSEHIAQLEAKFSCEHGVKDYDKKSICPYNDSAHALFGNCNIEYKYICYDGVYVE